MASVHVRRRPAAVKYWRRAALAAASGSAPDRPAVGRNMDRLTQRADFLAAAAGLQANARAFVVQARRRDDDEPARLGLTVSRKVGSAVERNRARRRLRAVVKAAAYAPAAGHDYVL